MIPSRVGSLSGGMNTADRSRNTDRTGIEPHYGCRLARADDIVHVIRAYKSAYGAAAWPGVGPRSAHLFLEDHLSSSDHVLVVCEDAAGVIVAACFGTARPSKYYRFLWESNPSLILAYLRDITRRPRMALVIAKQFNHDLRAAAASLLHLEKRRAQRPMDLPTGTAHMAHFFVRPNERGNRIGTMVIGFFESVMRARGLLLCDIRTTNDNIASRRAIELAGYRTTQIVGNTITFQKPL